LHSCNSLTPIESCGLRGVAQARCPHRRRSTHSGSPLETCLFHRLDPIDMDVSGEHFIRTHAEELDRALQSFMAAVAMTRWDSSAGRAFHLQVDALAHSVSTARRALLATL
jgi:hypothetical protein